MAVTYNDACAVISAQILWREKHQTHPDELSDLLEYCNSTFLGSTVIYLKSVGEVGDNMDCDAVLYSNILGI